MTKIYSELPDHVCPGAREWSNRGNLYFEGYACWCSPIERHWKFDWNGETFDVRFCPACGKVMNPARERMYLYNAPEGRDIFRQVTEEVLNRPRGMATQKFPFKK